MIDYDKEQLITFEEAAASVPVPVHRQTIQNWSKRGVCGILLESYRIGNRSYTSAEAVQRFLAKLNEQQAP